MAERLEQIPVPPQPGHVSEFGKWETRAIVFYLLAIARLAGLPMELLVDDDLELPDKLSEHALRLSPRKQKRAKRTGSHLR